MVFNTRELGASDGIIGIPIVRIRFGLFAIDTSHAPSFFLLVLVLVMAAYAGLRLPDATRRFGRQLGRHPRQRVTGCPFLGCRPLALQAGRLRHLDA